MGAMLQAADIGELRRRLEEAEETLRAIRSGEVDALVVDGPEGEHIFTLRGADHSYRVLIEAMQQGAAGLSSDGVITYCNRSFAEMLNSPQEKVVGAAVAGLLPPSQRETFEALLGQGHFRSSQGELELQNRDTTIRPVHVALNPLELIDGTTICLILTDLTEHKQHQDLQNASRRKDEFLAMLAHELRNPLAPILNAVAILNHLGPADEKLTYGREVIERQAHHLARLVDDLLDVSRISLGKVKLQKERTELAAVVARAVETSRPVIDARGHRLRLSLPSKEMQLDADPTRLAQVISNLLTNAAKYTDEGGSIWLTTERVGGEIVIRIRDTGMGIAEDLLPRVFDLFTQGDRSLARSEGGLGIGLTLVRRLVELHGGTVEATSDGAGRGSEFIVRLPALAEEEHSGDRHADRPNALPGQASRSILLVEDNRDGAESLALLLKLMGHQASIAYSGAEAIELARSLSPQAVLLDIGLPGMSGYEVALRLRRLPGYESVVMIAMTGYGQEEDKQRSRDAGIDHHLTKPLDLATLKGLLENLEPSRP
jgi:PAS domain S-box-containing protein